MSRILWHYSCRDFSCLALSVIIPFQHISHYIMYFVNLNLLKILENPLQYSCLENSMDRGAWQATVPVVTKSQTQLSDYHSLRVFLPASIWPSTASSSIYLPKSSYLHLYFISIAVCTSSIPLYTWSTSLTTGRQGQFTLCVFLTQIWIWKSN